MTTRREIFKLGAVSALGLAGFKGGDDDIPPTGATTAPAAPPVTASLLAPQNMPVPYAGVFRRPPELVPFQTGFDGGDPARPFARYALTQKLGRARFVPGLDTTVAGYNGIFPGPDHPGHPGHPDRGADPQRPARRRASAARSL